jgi:hypothetical protein
VVAAIVIGGPASVVVGDGFQLTVRAFDSSSHLVPSPALTWASTDTSVASVSTLGFVSARSIGTTTIYARAGSLIATYVVVVQPPAPIALSLAVLPLGDLDAAIQAAPGQTIRLTSYEYRSEFPYTIVSAGGSITWTSSRPDLAAVNASGVVTAIADGEAVIQASVDQLVATKSIKIASTPGVTTVRVVNAVERLGAITFRPSTGTPVSLSFGESREQTVPAGTFQVTADGSFAGSVFAPDWLDSEEFLGILPAQTHSTFVVVANASYSGLFGSPTFVPLWDWTSPVPADSVVVRVVLGTSGGYNVYFVEPGGSMGTPFLRGCYLDWPSGFSDYAARGARPFDILLQGGKDLSGPETARLPVTPQTGRAMTFVVVGDTVSGFTVVSLVDR